MNSLQKVRSVKSLDNILIREMNEYSFLNASIV